MRRGLPILWGLLLLPLWPLLRGEQILQHDGFLSDLIHAVGPYRVLQGKALARGEFPLWLPEIYSGIPFAGQIEAGVYYLPNLLLFAALEPVWATNLSVVLSVLIGGSGMFLLARTKGTTTAGAIFAGLCFALGGWNVSHFRQLNLHEAVAFFPWLWWAAERALGGRGRAWGTLAMLIAAQALAGHPQVSYYSVLFLVGLVVARSIAGRDASGLLPFGLAAAAGTLLAGVALAPALAFALASDRAGGVGWEFASGFALHPRDLISFLSPAITGSPYDCSYRSAGPGALAWESNTYVGLAPFCLAMWQVWRRREDRALALAALLLLLFAMGALTPLYGISWSLLPGMQLFRHPNRVLFIVTTIAALLAARALTAQPLAHRPRFVAAVVLLTLVDLGLFLRPWLPTDPAPVWHRSESPLLGAAAPGDRVYTFGAWRAWNDAFRDRCESGSEAAFRELATIPLASNAPVLGWETADGYSTMVADRSFAVWGVSRRQWLDDPIPLPALSQGRLSPEDRSLLARAAVTHVVTIREEGETLRLDLPRLREQGRFALHRLPDAVPRAYVSSTWGRASDADSARQALRCPGRAPIVEDGVAAVDAEGCPPQTTITPAVIVARSSSEVRISLPAAAGMLVLAESGGPGWSATVDGEAAEILWVNAYQRGVAVDSGDREVVFRYDPPGLRAGVVLSSIGVLGWMTMLLFHRRFSAAARG